MPSTLVSRNVTVMGRRTSVRLEPDMWDALAELCRRENRTVHDICSLVAEHRQASSLTAALRVFIVAYFREAATEEGHVQAGHGVVAKRLAASRRGIATGLGLRYNTDIAAS